ncbi:MAG: type II CAAX prenyl endopeptidase Rce1 family protein [Acidobacteriota bacterium]
MEWQPAQKTSGEEKEVSGRDRLVAAFEILAVAAFGDFIFVPLFLFATRLDVTAILGQSHILFLVLIAKATVSLILIGVLLRVRKQNFKTIGWEGRRMWKEASIGAAFLPLCFGVIALVGFGFQMALPEFVTEYNPLLALLQESGDLLLFLISSIYVGGIQEEIQRAFILVRFEHLGGSMVGLILWSVYFGAGHSVQGLDNAIKAGILGLLFGLLYLRQRNLTAPIVSHALYDVTTVLIFWFFMRG